MIEAVSREIERVTKARTQAEALAFYEESGSVLYVIRAYAQLQEINKGL